MTRPIKDYPIITYEQKDSRTAPQQTSRKMKKLTIKEVSSWLGKRSIAKRKKTMGKKGFSDYMTQIAKLPRKGRVKKK